MTAVLYDDVVTVPPAPSLTLAPRPNRHRSGAVATRSPRVTRGGRGRSLLAIPLRHMYAVLWRVGC